MKGNLQAIERFFIEDITPEELSEILDRVLFDYMQYVIRDKDRCGSDETAEDCFQLQELTTALKQCK